MKQTVVVKLTRPDTLVVDTSAEVKQVISGRDPVRVELTDLICKSISSGQLALIDIELIDNIKTTLDFNRYDRKDLCEMARVEFCEKASTEEIADLCKEMVVEMLTEKPKE